MGRASIKDHENLLQVFMILLSQELITTAYVSQWADTVLASEEESEYAFIELSTIRNIHDLLQILKKYSAKADPEICSRAVLGIVHHLLHAEKITLKKAFETATHISYEESLTSDEQFLLYRFYDHSEFNLYEHYESLKLFKSNFRDLLEIYQVFTPDNHEVWPEINERLMKDLLDKLDMVKQQYPY